MNLDKTYFKKQSFNKAADHQAVYGAMSEEKRAEAWRYLMEVAYGFVGKEWPRMDKNVFSRRSRKDLSE